MIKSTRRALFFSSRGSTSLLLWTLLLAQPLFLWACDDESSGLDLTINPPPEVFCDECEVDATPTCTWSCDYPRATQGRCEAGQCVWTSCQEGFADCDQDPSSGCEASLMDSMSHCGGCDLTCGVGERCEEGVCFCGEGVACEGGARCCEGACVQEDDPSCLCEGAPCEGTCCQGSCVDLLQSPTQCGACGVACGEDQVCHQGSCLERGPCASGETRCFGERRWRCVDDAWVSESCPAEAQCNAGQCICPSGQGYCDGVCVDLLRNDAHCGACENNCTLHPNIIQDGSHCFGGECVYACDLDFDDCSDDPGCETDLLDDDEHCGECELECENGECIDGICEVEEP